MTDELKKRVIEKYGIAVDEAQWNEKGCVKINSCSWEENSIYRHLSIDYANEIILEQMIDIAENEFLRWDFAATKKGIFELVKSMRIDKDIPAHSAWKDRDAFEESALKALVEILKTDEGINLFQALDTAIALKSKAEKADDMKSAQIYERIEYELSRCSVIEFRDLKKAVL